MVILYVPFWRPCIGSRSSNLQALLPPALALNTDHAQRLFRTLALAVEGTSASWAIFLGALRPEGHDQTLGFVVSRLIWPCVVCMWVIDQLAATVLPSGDHSPSQFTAHPNARARAHTHTHTRFHLWTSASLSRARFPRRQSPTNSPRRVASMPLESHSRHP